MKFKKIRRTTTSVGLKLGRRSAEKQFMILSTFDAGVSLMMMSVLSVIIFCFCCHQFLREITKPLPVMNRTAYARPALRVGKAYRIFSWAVLMMFFLVGLVISFVEVFTRL